MFDYPTLIKAAELQAAGGCGQSDVLYETRVQALYRSILSKAPDEDRIETEAALRARGFNPDFIPYEPSENDCSLTGITIKWCPCGRHL